MSGEQAGTRIALQNPVRRLCFLIPCLLLISAYLGLVTKQSVAAYFAKSSDLSDLQRAVRLEPGNAEYHDKLGQYLSLIQNSPELALPSYRAAVALNPHQAHYWFDLANDYQSLEDTERQTEAMQRAISTDPTTPELAWEAANQYLVQGNTQKALHEFRVVIEDDSYLPASALQMCWKVQPDIDLLLRDVVPPTVMAYSSFLELLTTKGENAAAAKVWSRIVELRQPFPASRVFEYIRYLIGQREVHQAQLVWQQAAAISGLASYQPSAENLVVNGDFSLEVLNGGFDWLYSQPKGVALALDPTQTHYGSRSLLIVFEGPGVSESGIRQLIPVQPSSAYDFSASFKAEDIQGAGGPQFTIQDAYSEHTFYASDDLKDADFWKPVDGNFATGPETKLLALRILRVPAASPIRGKLWISSIRLAPHKQQGNGS